MPAIANNEVESFTITVEFPKGTRLTQAQKTYLTEESTRRVIALIQTMTFQGDAPEKKIDESNNEHKTRGQDEQK